MADDVEPGGDCTCGGKIAKDRRDGFCSSWCRTRDAQGQPPQSPPPLVPPTVLVPAAAEPSPSGAGEGSEEGSPAAPAVADDPEPKRPSYRLRRRKIADEVEDRLRQANLLNTYQAAQVLDLADALDWTGGSLSARATAHRELERQMSELLRGQDEPGSGVGGMRSELDERRARREQQRAAGGAG